MVNTLSNLTDEERLKKIRLPSSEYRRLRADMIEVYRILKGIEKMDINIFFYYHRQKYHQGNT